MQGTGRSFYPIWHPLPSAMHLRRGQVYRFHKRVQDGWERTANGGNIAKEHTIELSQISDTPSPRRRGRLDLFIDELGDYVSVVEIKCLIPPQVTAKCLLD